MGHPEVAWIHEPDKLWRLMIEERVRPLGIGRGTPDFRMLRVNMGLVFGGGMGVAPMAVGAAETDIRASVHVTDALMAGDTPVALQGSLRGRLAGMVMATMFFLDGNQVRRFRRWQWENLVGQYTTSARSEHHDRDEA